jgi:hypothetical protein
MFDKKLPRQTLERKSGLMEGIAVVTSAGARHRQP